MEKDEELWEDGLPAMGPLQLPDINKTKCRDCAFREADRLDGRIKGATLGICQKYKMKPHSIVWDGAPCKYYKKG